MSTDRYRKFQNGFEKYKSGGHGENSVAIGHNSSVQGDRSSIAIGANSEASGDSSTAVCPSLFPSSWRRNYHHLGNYVDLGEEIDE